MGGGKPERAVSVTTASVNLTKNLVGAGIFSLPTALLRGSLVPGLLVMLLVGTVQGISFVMIAYLCKRLNFHSYRDIFSHAFGKRTGNIVDMCIATNSFFACVAYMILVADFLQKALEGLVGWESAPRPLLIWSTTIIFTLPLSHFRDLSALRYTSFLGLAIIAMVFLYVTRDFLVSGSTARANLRAHSLRLDMGIFTTLALCTGAFQAHYNSPKFFRELGGDLQAHARTVLLSFGTAFVIYSSFATAGLGLFGIDLLGNVLKNYPSGNTAVLLAWLGMAFSITFTYPLVFTTGRDSLMGMAPALQRAEKIRPRVTHVCLTSGLVMLISSVACYVEDVSVVTGLLGATIGSCLCWIFPASIYLRVIGTMGAAPAAEALPLPGSSPKPRMRGRSALLAGCAMGMVAVGALSMLVGIGKTLRLF